MRFVREIMAVALGSAIVITGTGCSIRPEHQEELLRVSEEYARSLACCDLIGIETCCDPEFDDVENMWIDRLDFNQGKYYEAVNSANCAARIAESITYELKTDTLDISNDTGSVVCEFSIPDYETAMAQPSVRSIYDFYDVMFAYDYVVHSVRLEFELVEDTWLATNYEDVMSDIYEFTLHNISYETPLSDKVLGQRWYYDLTAQSGNYYSADMIDLDIVLTSDADFSSMYYEVEYEGQVIKRETGSTEGYLFATDEFAPAYRESEYDYDSGEYYDVYYLVPGDYTITFYDEYGEVLISDVAHVLN